MSDRDLKYIDMDRVNQRINEGDFTAPADDSSPEEVLAETILDLIQVGVAEGMSQEEVDGALRRVSDYRARKIREKFTLHVREE